MEKARSTFAVQQSKQWQEAGAAKRTLMGRLSVGQPSVSVKDLDAASRPTMRRPSKIEFRNRPRFERVSSSGFSGKLDVRALVRR